VSDHVWDMPKLVVPPGGMQHFSMRFIRVIRDDASILNFSITTITAFMSCQNDCIYKLSITMKS